MVIVSNPESAFYESRGRVVKEGVFIDQDNYEDRGLVPVWLKDEEKLVFFKETDIKQSGSSKNLRLPHSRKEFYTFIHDSRTQKNDIVEVLRMLAQKNKMTFTEPKHDQDGESYTLENLIKVVEHSSHPSEIVEEIRIKRDAELMTFDLPNNNMTAKVASSQNRSNNKSSKKTSRKKTYKKKKVNHNK